MQKRGGKKSANKTPLGTIILFMGPRVWLGQYMTKRPAFELVDSLIIIFGWGHKTSLSFSAYLNSQGIAYLR